MADRFPLILNTSTNQIQEIPSGDNLDLTGVGINNAGIITASSFSGPIVAGAGTSDIVAGIITATQIDLNGDIDVDGHTNLDNVNIAGVTTFSEDITLNGQNFDITYDRSQNTVSFDQSFLKFGTSGNMSIRNSNIEGLTTIKAPGLYIRNMSNAQMITCYTGGRIELYHNNNKKLDTTSTGIDITGNVVASGNVTAVDGTFSGNVSIGGTLTYEDVTNVDSVGIITAREGVVIPDNKQLKFGNSTDFKIEHNSNENYIDSNSGHIYIRANVNDDEGDNIYIQPKSGENSAIFIHDGGVELYYDNSKKFETDGNGITVQGNINMATDSTLFLGVGNDFKLFHNGTSNFIRSANGNIRIDDNSGVLNAQFIPAGSSELYFNGSKKFETTSSGVTVTGTINFGSGMGSGLNSNGFNINFADSNGAQDMAKFGDSGDLKIYHQSNSSYIINATGNLNIGSNNEVRIKGGSDVAEMMIKCVDNGAVELYHDGTKRFETTALGVSAEYYTGADNAQLRLGDSGDLQLYHNATHSYLDNTTGKLHIRNNIGTYHGNGIHIEALKDEDSIVCNPNGAVKLYFDDNLKFETITGGAVVTGDLGVGDASNPSHQYDQGIHVHANGTGAVLHLTDGSSGSGTGDGFDIISHASTAYLWQRENANMVFGTQGVSRWNIYGSNGHFAPSADNTYDIGTTSVRVRNLYVNDLQLSNKGKKDEGGNDVDGTWGDFTIQEGESDLFLINNRSGKKYKFNLTEVS